jgi:hypothetical protein|uniref:Uncharacterized protein n=1 Tax=Myoviridae sp. ctshb19 TaxID=2825194 RepID=A0A8S5UG16_9CAUD|nr:MAG TPA: hypothetical protein [Myoviridae sp. ctshb19]
MCLVTVTEIPAHKLDAYMAESSRKMREIMASAARGECEWICADCLCSDPMGMPDQCFHGQQRCTEIIQRDKLRAMREGNEPQ